MDAYKNFALSEVAIAPSPATSGTTLYVKAGQGVRFPVPPFNASIWPKNTLPDPTNGEIVRVTALATDTLTILRAQEGTTARTILVGDLIAASITEKMITDLAAVIPAGADKQVQVNDGGVLAGFGTFWFDKAAAQLGVSNFYASAGHVAGNLTVDNVLNVGTLGVAGNTHLYGTLITDTHVTIGGELNVPAGSLSMAGWIYEAGRGVPSGHSAAWTPVWHPDMQLGTSTQTAYVTRIGNMVFWSLMLLVGPGAYLVPSALVLLTLPTSYLAQHPIQFVGDGIIYVNGVEYYKIGTRAYDGTRVVLTDSAMVQISNNNPYPDWFVSGSRIFLKGWYQENGY